MRWSPQVTEALITLAGYLLVAAFGGLALLKAYDEFRKGIETKSRLRIWSAFFIGVFLFLALSLTMFKTQCKCAF